MILRTIYLTNIQDREVGEIAFRQNKPKNQVIKELLDRGLEFHKAYLEQGPRTKAELTQEMETRLDYSNTPNSEKIRKTGDRIDKLSQQRKDDKRSTKRR